MTYDPEQSYERRKVLCVCGEEVRVRTLSMHQRTKRHTKALADLGLPWVRYWVWDPVVCDEKGKYKQRLQEDDPISVFAQNTHERKWTTEEAKAYWSEHVAKREK